MKAERKETTVYHGDTPIRKKAASKITGITDDEAETICRGLELLQDSQSEYRTLAAEILRKLDGIRAKKPEGKG